MIVSYLVGRSLFSARLPTVKDSAEGALTVIKRSGGAAVVVWASRGLPAIEKKGPHRGLERDRSSVQLVLWPNS
jgi:hypothetical protein